MNKPSPTASTAGPGHAPAGDAEAPPSQRAPAKLGRIQAWSGALFALFLVLHLATAASAIAGIDRYNSTLQTLRHLYRPHVVVEIVLIGCSGAVHIACAVLQMVRRRRVVAWSGPWWMRAHRLTGYFLLLVIGGHVLATRVAPTLATGATATGMADFSFLAYATLWLPAFFWPYYIALGICGSIHLAIGLHLARRILLRQTSAPHGPAAGPRRPAGHPTPAFLVTGAVVTLLVVSGVLGILGRAGDAPRTRFPEYKALFDKLLP